MHCSAVINIHSSRAFVLILCGELPKKKCISRQTHKKSVKLLGLCNPLLCFTFTSEQKNKCICLHPTAKHFIADYYSIHRFKNGVLWTLIGLFHSIGSIRIRTILPLVSHSEWVPAIMSLFISAARC